jgi:signal transduction histidine kinase
VPDRSFILPERMPWYRWIGPWPLRPVVTYVLATYFFLVTAAGQLMGMGAVDAATWVRVGLIAIFPAAPAAAAGIVALGGRWQRSHGVHVGSYLVFICLAAASAVVFRFLTGAIPSNPYSEALPIGLAVFRVMVMLFIVQAVAGAVSYRLQRQVTATQQALDQVRDQQVIMLEADETARRQVAALLHDRVQAGLIAACLELQMLSKHLGDSERPSILEVVNKLERLRTLDVRRAARALSPSLDDIDLKSSIEELAAQYEPAMGATVNVDPRLESDRKEFRPEVLLATYRIVEQALLNAATHGRAEHVDVDISLSDDRVNIRVRDDGLGMDDLEPTPGLGLVVIETWTHILHGSWSFTSAPSEGTTLQARIRIS